MVGTENAGQPRKLWKTFSTVLGWNRVAETEAGGPTAQGLLEYFTKKIADIRKSTGASPPTTRLPHSRVILDSFKLFTVDEVREVILSTKSKSCSLDPIPTAVLKEFLTELLPFVTEMCNRSLQLGRLPLSQRHAIVKPILKKEGLDQDDVKNYRPISNLTYISKLVERMVCKQLTAFLEEHSLLPEHQSGFRARHSTETALLKVFSDIMSAADRGEVTLLGLLDMSAAFDTVDHDILLHRLEESFGFAGSVLNWLRSFLRGRTQQVVFNGLASTVAEVTSGVPQGSVLEPLLFLLYTADIPVIASEHGLGIHCYADDGQLYVFGKANCADKLVLKVTTCIGVVDAWMSSNRLKLNSDKTQFIWLGSQQQLQKIEIESVALLGDTVVFQPTVNDLGVTIDGPLTMREHVQRICRASYYQLRQLRVVRNSLSTDVCVMLVHAFVSSRLDYCNSLLAGVSDELVNRLQSVLRSAARLVLRKRKFDPISIDLRERLHWLPIRQRIQYKLGLLVYKCLHGLAPSYLSDMLTLVSADPYSCRLRSAAHGDLTVPWTRTVRLGPRSFAVSGPKFWNSLAPELKHPNISLASFKSLLKTELFIRAYPDR